MKYLPALFLSLLQIPALADTARIGDAVIPYTAPVGFVRADSFYPIDLADLDQQFDLHTVIFAQYVPAADISIRKENPRAIPSWYVHLAYDSKYSQSRIDGWLFNIAAPIIDKLITHQYGKQAFTHKLETILGGALRRKITIESMTQKGLVEKTPRLRSMLAYAQGTVENDNGKMERFAMASLTTFILIEGRWITVLQGARIPSEADLPAFTAKARRIAAEIIQKKRLTMDNYE
jgi:hypothetical protein